jgi:CzcA family heavy metal efflux pump
MDTDTGILNRIVRFSLRFRGIVISLSILFGAYGLYTLTQAKYDVFPEFAPPQAVIQTEAPGLSPEQVEVLVTQPIENAVNGMSGIQSLRSSSIQGLSVVTITFQSGTDIYLDRQLVTERLTTLSAQLPQGVKPPSMTPLVPTTGLLYNVGLTSKARSLMELRTFADWTMKQRLLAVPGVAKVTVFGGDVKQLQIQVRPDKLVQYRMAIDDVLAAARRATGVQGAGFIDTENQRVVLQTEGQSLTPSELSATALRYERGRIVRLGDVANVVQAPEPPVGAASIDGKTGVQVQIWSQYGSNILEVTKRVEVALHDLQPAASAEGIDLNTDIFRPANFIDRAIANMRSSLLIGAVLVVVVLFLFLFNLRTAAISCTAIPLSLLAGVVVLERLGLSLNTMTLGGLAIAIGEVVDDAVIDVENILRRLRENRALGNPKSVFRVVLDASMEVRTAVVYATFAVVLVFIPILTISGIAGKLFAPLGVAYIFAILASLGVALTVTPALSFALLGSQHYEQTESVVAVWLRQQYLVLLNKIERNARALVLVVGFLVMAGIAAVQFLGGSFLPDLREGHFIVHVSTVPGTSLQESLRLGELLSAQLLKIPSVRAVAQRAGRAEQGEDTWGTHYSEFDVDLKELSAGQMEQAQADIRKTLTSFVGVNSAVKTFLAERIEETLSGYTASVVINIFGNDLDVLDAKAQETAKVLSGIPGATDVQVQSPPGMPLLAIRLRKDDLMKWGFNAVDVLDAVQTAYQGTEVGQVYDGNRVFTISVILDAQDRRSIDRVGDLLLRNSDSAYVRLRQLADIYETSGRYVVLHQGARRVQTVTCNVAGRDLTSFVDDAKRRIASDVTLPAGMYFEYGGTAAAQAQSKRDLLVHSLLAGAGIVLLLSVVLKNVRNLLLVLVNLPFALVGGVLAVFFSGGTISVGSLVGFVTLFGITMRNSIMLISHYEHLVNVEGMTWGMDAAMRGASERLVPILMTALVTALGLLPMALGSGSAGREIEGPMAIVILGGLATSTILNLLVLPTLALRFSRFTPPSDALEN